MTEPDIKGVINRIRDAAVMGVTEGAAVLHAQAIPLTPFRSGDLRNSMNINPGFIDGDRIEASVYATSVYATRQHEEFPNKHHPGTQMKFLEEPAQDPAVQAHIKAVIAKHIRSNL